MGAASVKLGSLRVFVIHVRGDKTLWYTGANWFRKGNATLKSIYEFDHR